MNRFRRHALQVRNFFDYTKEFGPRAAVQIACNHRRPTPVASLRVRRIPTPVYYRPGTSDFATLRQTLGLKESQVRLNDPRVIVDAGANIGSVSLQYAVRYPKARVIAIEPDPGNCEMFRRNCEAYPNITLIQAALWPHREFVYLSTQEREPNAFQVTRDSDDLRVQAVTMGDMLELAGAEGIDLLKIDIEGAERELFRASAGEWMPHVRAISVELHDHFAAGCSEALLGAIGSRPYERRHSGEYWHIQFG